MLNNNQNIKPAQGQQVREAAVVENRRHINISLKLFVIFSLIAFLGLIYVAFYMPTIVPSSSTTPLAILTIIPVSIIAGFIGVLIGKFVIFISKKRAAKASEENKAQVFQKTESFGFLISIILFFIFVSLFAIYQQFNPERVASEEANQFGVKTDKGIFSKVSITNTNFSTHVVAFDCKLGNYLYGPYYEFDWKESKIDLTEPTKFLPYINTVSRFYYDIDGESYYFLLADLRATSERSMLIIYKYPNEIVYKELIERKGLYYLLGVGTTLNKEVIVTISKYEGDLPDFEYNLCNFPKKPEQGDFKLLGYGYKLDKNTLNSGQEEFHLININPEIKQITELYDKRMFKEGVEVGKEIISTNTYSDKDKSYIYYLMGHGTYHQVAPGSREIARQYIEESLKLNQNRSGSYQILSAIENDEGNYQKSIEYAQKCLDLSKNPIDSATCENNLGLAYANLGNKDEAIKHLEMAISLDPSTPVYKENLSRVQAELR